MKYSFSLTTIVFFLITLIAQAQIPQTISYQGLLTDANGKVVPDGTYQLAFKLYNAETGGSDIWSESQTVVISNGIINVILGSSNPLNLPFDKTYWLGITINPGSELVPRIQLTSSAYSMNARTVPDSSLKNNKIAKGQVIRNINSITDDVKLTAGSNVNISTSGNTITISALGSSGGNTLDQAYDQGGAGAGRQIIADSGPVEISGSDGLVITGEMNSTSQGPKLSVRTTDSKGVMDWSRSADIRLIRSVPDDLTGKNTQGLLVMSEYTSPTGTYYAPKAVEARVYNQSTGKITEASAFHGLVNNTTTGTIELAYGLYSRIQNLSSGTIKKASGVFIGQPYNAGTIENNYGLFIRNQNFIANSYAIYAEGGKSYFADPVGIGTDAPGNMLTVVQGSPTDPIADAWTTYSSRRWKTNIKPIENALVKVQQLRGVSFDWKKDGSNDIGLIAEEVGEVIPEVVVYEDNGSDAKSVDYARLVAVLIEAVKEQQKQLDHQRKTIDVLQERLLNLEQE